MVEAVFIGTIIPLLFMLGLLRHSRPLFGCFCWGAVSFLLIYLVSPILYGSLGWVDEFRRNAILIGPTLEEILKPLPLFLIAAFGVRSLTPFFYILGLACGMGFAIEENLVYLIRYFESEEQSRLLMIVRSLSTCLMHGVATGWTGYLLTLAKRRHGLARRVLPVVGIATAAAYHGVFNWLMLEGRTVAGLLLAFVLFVVFLYTMKERESRAPETRGTVWE